jgi:hypothetical protein
MTDVQQIQKDGFIKFFSGLTGVVVVVEMCSIRTGYQGTR